MAQAQFDISPDTQAKFRQRLDNLFGAIARIEEVTRDSLLLLDCDQRATIYEVLHRTLTSDLRSVAGVWEHKEPRDWAFMGRSRAAPRARTLRWLHDLAIAVTNMLNGGRMALYWADMGEQGQLEEAKGRMVAVVGEIKEELRKTEAIVAGELAGEEDSETSDDVYEL